EVKEDQKAVLNHLLNKSSLPVFNGELEIIDGEIQNELTIIHARSIAENIKVLIDDEPFSGKVKIKEGRVENGEASVVFFGKSLMHSAPLTAKAFTRSFFGEWGKYIVSIGLLLFAFSTAISWSYYGDRSVTFLFGAKYVVYYRLLYVVGFFFAGFTDTTIIWNLSLLTVVFMAIPNLFGILLLRKDVRSTIKNYWITFKKENPDVKIPEKL
ncbi:MAG: sodium:alanine symporter family protein, partial [Bacteroidales bacterium]|nr:sodium:alanine symporter family protein [Bacteroidales bacterium]